MIETDFDNHGKMPICADCGSTDIVIDSTAKWNVVIGEWELAGTQDCVTCEECGASHNYAHWIN